MVLGRTGEMKPDSAYETIGIFPDAQTRRRLNADFVYTDRFAELLIVFAEPRYNLHP